MRLISETSPTGVITYVNDVFCRISGFSREELIGAPHNIVRHPDMPSAVFANFWATLKAGKPWLGLVKNRCKNGDHYWVSAYVTPIWQDGRVVGYQSVRTRPEREQVERAERLYRHLRQRKRLPWAPLDRFGLRAGLFGAGSVVAGIAAAQLTGAVGLGAGVLAVAGAALAGVGLARPLTRADRRARSIFDNDVGCITYGGGRGELAAVRLAFAMEYARSITLLGRLEDFVERLAVSAEITDRSAAQTGNIVRAQLAELDTVTAAMERMLAAAREISRNTAEGAASAEQAARQTEQGKTVIERSLEAMTSMAAEVEHGVQAMERLKEHVERIRSVLDVIGGISEQTNLLALNAAIEAARAGEQGRGFAVVAEEVRALARRAGDSTKTISELIEQLLQGTDDAVMAMARGQAQARQVAVLAGEANDGLGQTEDGIRRICGMAEEIARATEQQRAVAEEISRNLQSIRAGVQESAQTVTHGKRVSDELVELVSLLQGTLRQFSR